MAYFHTSRLFASLEKKRARAPDQVKLVGVRLARVLHAQICLLLDTQARQTATRSALVQSQLCLQASTLLAAPATGLSSCPREKYIHLVCINQVAMHPKADGSMCASAVHHCSSKLFGWNLLMRPVMFDPDHQGQREDS